MAFRLQRCIQRRIPALAGAFVVSQLPLEMPVMANWAWWDFGILAIGGFLIMWGLAPEIRKALPVTITIVEDESDRGLPSVLFTVFLLLLLAGYVKLLGEHIVMQAEYERLFDFQRSKIEALEQEKNGGSR